jgi:predicted phage-related endonuclease
MPALTPANDAIRAVNITASEVGALLGDHPYTDPGRIWDRLCDPFYTPDPQSESMALGVYFERYIAKYAAQRMGLKLRANSRTRVHPEVMLAATPDYLVLNRPMLVEVKLSSIIYGWSEDSLASHIEWQARAQLAVTNRDVCIIAALVGSKFYQIPVVREMRKERLMLETVELFVRDHIKTGVRPVVEIPQLRNVKVEKGGR